MRRDGQGLVLLAVQMTLCVVLLAVVFTMQYLEPEQYKTLGTYYAKVMSQNRDAADDETLRLLTTPITVEQLREWWESWEPEKLASVFARTDKQAAMGGEETVFPRNASYRNVVVSAAARSPLACDAVITSLYGERSHPISGAWDFHTGVDLAAPAGTGIYPIYPGVVTATGYPQAFTLFGRTQAAGLDDSHMQVILLSEQLLDDAPFLESFYGCFQKEHHFSWNTMVFNFSTLSARLIFKSSS